MNIKISKTTVVSAVIAAIVAVQGGLAGAAESGKQTLGGRQMSENNTKQEMRAVAETSALSISSSSNYLALTGIMASGARESARDFFNRVKLDGKQCFMPDFCKMKYVVVGGMDGSGYVSGFYNPFYDTWIVLYVDTVGASKITGFKVASGSYFTGSPAAEYPAASGAVPADAYTKGVFLQTKAALFAMRDKLSGKDFKSAFENIPAFTDAQVRHLAELTKFRIGQALKVAEDKRVLRDAVIANSIVCKGMKRLVCEDGATKLTLKTLGENLASVRQDFKIIAYFPSGDETNLIYSYRLMPTLLVQANVGKDGRTWLKMFDAKSVSQELK